MNIEELKKELSLTNTKIAEFFGLKPIVYANSSAKKRYEKALCKFYNYINNSTMTNYINDYKLLCRDSSTASLTEQKRLFENQKPLNHQASVIYQMICDEIEIREVEQAK